MQHAGNRALEHAQAMVDLERDRVVARVRSGLRPSGRADCADCGEEIAPKRRAALPSAVCCATCQSRRERKARRGW